MQGASVRSGRVSSPADDPAWSRNQAEYALNIVIVDDQTSARTMLRHVIEDIAPELSVHDFGDPLTALAWCEAHPVDLLLLDYRMPEMDGLEFARRFRRLPKHRDIPVILIPGPPGAATSRSGRRRWKQGSSTSWSSRSARANCARAATTCCSCASRPRM